MAYNPIDLGDGPNTPSGDDLYTGAGKINSNFSSIDDQIAALQFEGAKTYQTLAALNAVSPVPDDGTAAKVVADSTASNNGYYSVVSGSWVKDASFATGAIESGNTEAVTGGDIFDEVQKYSLNSGGATSYSNEGGQGDRTNIIDVYVSPSLKAGGADSNLVNGLTTNNYTGSIAFNAVDVSGLYILFDFRENARKIIKEATWYQSATNSNGTWKWQGSLDNSSWTDIGNNFTLGGVSTQIQTELSSNVDSFRYYRLLGVSGTASGAPYLQEITFKITGSVTDKYPDINYLGDRINDRALVKLPSNVISYYPCDEGSGTVLTDIIGDKNADITSGGGTVEWTREGWLKLTSGWFKTPAQPSQTTVLLFKVPEGHTGYYLCAPNQNAIGQSYYDIPSSTVKKLSGWGISTVPRRTAAANGPADIFAGGWSLASHQIATQTNNINAIGCGNHLGAGAITSMEVAGILILSGTASDDDLNAIRTFISSQNKKRGICIDPMQASKKAHLAIVIGESTSEGTYPLSSLSADQRAAFNESVLIDARNDYNNNYTGKIMKRLSLTSSYANNNPPTRSTDSGLEVGLLNARIDRPNDGRPLHILKVAKGSTYLGPEGSYTNAAGGTTTIAYQITRNTATHLESGLFFGLELKNIFKIENKARSQNIGYTSVSVIYHEGLNDAYVGTNLVTDAATYKGYIQDHYDGLRSYLGIDNLKMICFNPHEPLGGLGAGDPDYPDNAAGADRLTALGYIRTAFTSFQSENSSNVDLLEGNDYELNNPGDYIHPSALGYSDMGKDAEALFEYQVEVIPTV